MERRTRSQEQRYTMALGYAYGAKDHAPTNSEAGRRAMVTSSMDFAMWYASQSPNNLEDCWETFSSERSETQRALAKAVATLPYISVAYTGD
jgi:hypothetical protein